MSAPSLPSIGTHDWPSGRPVDHSCILCPSTSSHPPAQPPPPFHEHGPLSVDVFSTGAVVSVGETDMSPEEAEQHALAVLRAVKVARALRGRQ